MEALIVLSVVVLHLPVILESKRVDDFGIDSVHFQVRFGKVMFLVSTSMVSRCNSVVCLDTLCGAKKYFFRVFHKLGVGKILCSAKVAVKCYREFSPIAVSVY